jgi:hypothetical protein
MLRSTTVRFFWGEGEGEGVLKKGPTSVTEYTLQDYKISTTRWPLLYSI